MDMTIWTRSRVINHHILRMITIIPVHRMARRHTEVHILVHLAHMEVMIVAHHIRTARVQIM